MKPLTPTPLTRVANSPDPHLDVRTQGSEPVAEHPLNPPVNVWAESQPDPQVDAQIGANARLRNALRDQQVVLDNAGVGIAFIRQRTVLRCNHRFAEIFNFASAAAAVGHSSQSLYPSESSFHALGKAAYAVMGRGQTFKSEVLCEGEMARFFGRT